MPGKRMCLPKGFNPPRSAGSGESSGVSGIDPAGLLFQSAPERGLRGISSEPGGALAGNVFQSAPERGLRGIMDKAGTQTPMLLVSIRPGARAPGNRAPSYVRPAPTTFQSAPERGLGESRRASNGPSLAMCFNPPRSAGSGESIGGLAG